MKTLCKSLALSSLAFGIPANVPAATDLVSFYSTAHAVTQLPPDKPDLPLLCRKQVGERWVSFIGLGGKKPVIASVTPFELKKPDKQISLRMQVHDPNQKKDARYPGTEDWAYLFDRNGDGRVDYFCYLMGAMPVKQGRFPSNYPKRGEGLSIEQIRLLIDSTKGVFYHCADDNFDGTVDGFVMYGLDPDRDWVEDWIAFRSTAYDNNLDASWRFRDDPRQSTGALQPAEAGFPYVRLGGRATYVDAAAMGHWTGILERLNEAATRCGYGAGDFRSR